MSFWGKGNEKLHADPEQIKRQKSATKVNLDPARLDVETSTCAIKDYVVSLDSCTCIDFERRKQAHRHALPCKHMYRLAHELNLFDIGPIHLDEKPHANPNTIVRSASDPANRSYYENFAWAVPKAFREALETCHFCQGDILYESPLAYSCEWSNIADNLRYSIQVKAPSRGPAKGKFEENWNHSVCVVLTDHHQKQTDPERIWTTQGRLYMLLKTGDISVLNGNSVKPVLPYRSRYLMKTMNTSLFRQKACEYIAQVCGNDYWTCFMVPYDCTVTASRLKYLWIKSVFPKDRTILRYPSPDRLQIGAPDKFVPTLYVACFLFCGFSEHIVFNTLKSVLYKPDPSKASTTDKFRLNAHGILIPHGLG